MTQAGSATKVRRRAQRDSSMHMEVANRYEAVRRLSETLARPLAPDDFNLQAMPGVSPAKWHLAHTSWFFETFVLKPFLSGYREFHPQFEHLFNSYYNQVGAAFPRPQRGLLSRPTLETVFRYRAHVDDAMTMLLATAEHERRPSIETRTELGCHHEEQHQELFLTDIKYNLSINPLRPAYRDDLPAVAAGALLALEWLQQPEEAVMIGHAGGGFAFDNEGPRHRALLAPHAIASRLVTNGEYLEFIKAGGYQRPEFWLSDGWQVATECRWQAPLYWEKQDGRWRVYTLGGMRPLNENEPVCHVSLYEADAYARWAGARLPTEFEWEALASQRPVTGNLREAGLLHPVPADGESSGQFFGDAWEWTQSAYARYPGFRAAAGALGEYNGKFMANQFVLRGGSCVTPAGHIRPSYRNFFYPTDRWQFSGIRLARDA